MKFIVKGVFNEYKKKLSRIRALSSIFDEAIFRE